MDGSPSRRNRSGTPPSEERRTAVEIEITGHAGLRVSSGETTVLVDPWLGGSAYWRSWWQYPPSPLVEPAALSPEYVMLSHHHFDHFHFPSMRRLDRNARLLIPRFAVDVMPKELKNLGFGYVTELDHGRRYELEGDISVASYQYGLDDSVIVIAVGDTVIFDVNDCKIRGRALAKVLEEFGRPTFLLKNYSAAQAYPHCYRAELGSDLEMLSPESYVADFLATTRAVVPRYAVPFASMVCFLHPDTIGFNSSVVTPDRVAVAFADDPVSGTELVVLAPGDRWSTHAGFTIGSTDWFHDRSARVEALAEAVAPKIEAQRRDEEAKASPFAVFATYMDEFVRSLPRPVRSMFTRPVCFGAGDRYWVVDIAGGVVTDAAVLPERWASVVDIAPGLLGDAIDRRVLNLVHISMRLKINLAPGGLSTDLMFWAMLIIFELGYFPLGRLDRRRVARVAWSRRRELAEMAVTAARTPGSLATRLSASFMAAPTT